MVFGNHPIYCGPARSRIKYSARFGYNRGGSQEGHFVRFIRLTLFATLSLYAQTNFVPSYYVATGVTYDYYGKSGFAANTELGIRVGQTSIFSYTTLELTSTVATIRTGAAKILFQSGNFGFIALGDAGLATGNGSTLGSFSGGGFLMYDIGSRVTKSIDHFYIGVGGRGLSFTGTTVKPIFEITFGKGF